MQEKKTKKTNFFERILQIIDFYNIKNVKSFACDYLGYKSSQKINRLKDASNSPSYEILNDISNKFENINGEWLLTGKEPMLREKEINQTPVAIRDTTEKHIPYVLQSAIAGFGNSNFAIQEQDVKEYYVIPMFKFLHIDFMIDVRGSSMNPKYNSGDIIACTILRERKFIQWNKCHVIATREQGILVKRLRQSELREYITAVSDNKEYPPFEIPESEITGIALVVGVIRLE
jgi:phage repressor protein C with HTH and peptisase S24 domain